MGVMLASPWEHSLGDIRALSTILEACVRHRWDLKLHKNPIALSWPQPGKGFYRGTVSGCYTRHDSWMPANVAADC